MIRATYMFTISLLGAAFFCSPVMAGTFYWTNIGSGNGSDTILRAYADGSGIQSVVTGLNEPRGVTADLTNHILYWAEPGSLAIRRGNMDGSGTPQTVVPIDAGGADVVLDLAGGKLYWTDANSTGTSGSVHRANLDGSNAETLAIGIHPAGIALDLSQGKVYWTDLAGHLDGNGSIRRANLDGSNAETVVTGIDEANGLAIDTVAGRLYWPELATDRIQSSNLDGTGLVNLVTVGLDNPTAIDLDLTEGRMYWTDAGGQQVNRISNANLNGTDVQVLISGVGVPFGITVVPEPSSTVLAAIGLAGLTAFKLRRRTSRLRAQSVDQARPVQT